MLKRIFFIFILVINCNNIAGAVTSNNFVPGIPDLPVPSNFTIKKDSSSIFFNDSGRIIEATFIGKGNHKDINNFYNKTLKALGWKRQKHLVFLREKEILNIKLVSLNNKDYNMTIYFSLKPQY